MAAKTVVRGGTLIDGTGAAPVSDGVVVIENGRIAAVGARADFGENGFDGAEVIDVRGKTIMPGLINCHQHLDNRHGYGSYQTRAAQPLPYLVARAARNALLDLQEGVTTIRDVASRFGTNLHVKKAIEDGMIVGPRVVACGQPIAMTGGHGWELCIEADGEDAVRHAARQLLKSGADLIKCMASGGFISIGVDQPWSPQLTAAEMRAAFDEAHNAGKPTTVHAHPPAAIQRAVEAGVDCIEHGALIDEASAELLAQKGIPLVPTLGESYVIAHRGEEFGRPAWLAELCRKKLEDRSRHFGYAIAAGVKMAVGTDVIGTMAEEIRLMVEGGLRPMDVLVAATRNGAEVCALLDQTGTLEPGKWADAIVLAGNPLEDLGALEHVELVFKEGVLYRPEALAAATGKHPL
ncbi:MAG: amidohydrolase family protein [Ardenticatenaceae bacterium]|nr:amidohydrolase family protein [Ardenticatenaceae bacterium]